MNTPSETLDNAHPARNTHHMAEYLNVAEVATRLRVSKMTIYRLVDAGEIPVVKVGRCFRVPAEGVDAYVERHTSEAVA